MRDLVLAALLLANVVDSATVPAAAQPPTAESRDHLTRGLELARQGSFEAAVDEIRSYVRAFPDDPAGHYWLGRSLLELAARSQRSSPEALESLERALELDPEADQVRVLLAEVYSSRLPSLFDPDRAIELYDDLLERQPERPAIPLRYARWILYNEVRLARAGSSERVHQDSRWALDLARELLLKALELLPDGTDEALQARLLLGEAQLRGGEWDAALASFRAVLDAMQGRSVNLAPVQRLIGHAHWRKGDYPAAAAAFRAAYDLAPTPVHQYDLMMAYSEAGGYPPDLPTRYRFALRDEAVPADPPALAFEDVAPRLGIDKLAGAGPAGWADYDQDGRYDLFVCGCDTYCTLYRASAGGFVDATAEAGLSGVEPGFGVAWADYDNDGDPDLYVSRNGWNGPAANSLLRNDGDGTFSEVAAAAGVADAGSSFHSAWFDYDRDGWLDLVVSNGVYLDGSTNRLYRNQSDGTFREVTREAALVEAARYGTIGVALGDYDDDGWPDIFFHGRMEPNRLYRNDRDGTFTEVAASAGIASAGTQNGYIALMADLDSDGDLDVFTGSVAKWPEVVAGYRADYRPGPLTDIPRLYSNNGDGTFSDVSLAVGLRYPLGIMAGSVADLDNDGYLDIYLGTGDPDLRRLEPNIFYYNVGGARFEDLTRFTGLGALGKGHGIVFLDWDQDGDLDMFAELGGFYPGDLSRSSFFLNKAGHRNHWLSLRLRQQARNREAIGARVTLRAGDWRQVQEVTAGRGFSSTDPALLHFGLGPITTLDRVDIRWPDGATQRLHDVAANQSLTILRR